MFLQVDREQQVLILFHIVLFRVIDELQLHVELGYETLRQQVQQVERYDFGLVGVFFWLSVDLLVGVKRTELSHIVFKAAVVVAQQRRQRADFKDPFGNFEVIDLVFGVTVGDSWKKQVVFYQFQFNGSQDLLTLFVVLLVIQLVELGSEFL